MDNDTTINSSFGTLITDNMRFRFQLELSQTTDQARKDMITNILKTYDVQEIQTEQPNKVQKMFENLDREIFKQPWSKLKLHQREVKLREYVNDKYKDNPDKEEVMTLLVSANASKHLHSADVAYDRELSKITDIPRVVRNADNKYELKVTRAKAVAVRKK
jgi:hypothetical protein